MSCTVAYLWYFTNHMVDMNAGNATVSIFRFLFSGFRDSPQPLELVNMLFTFIFSCRGQPSNATRCLGMLRNERREDTDGDVNMLFIMRDTK